MGNEYLPTLQSWSVGHSVGRVLNEHNYNYGNLQPRKKPKLRRGAKTLPRKDSLVDSVVGGFDSGEG